MSDITTPPAPPEQRPYRRGERRTRRHRVAIKALVAGHSTAEAAKMAGYKSPHHINHMMDPKNPAGKNFRQLFMALMDKAGLTDEALLRPIKTGLTARMPKWNNRKQDWDQFADIGSRLTAAKMGLELKGRFPSEQDKGPMVAVIVETNLEDPVGPEGEFFEVTAGAALAEGENGDLTLPAEL